MRKKILIVFGTRPEAIKMAPVVKAFQSDSDRFDICVCVTGQHREMLDQVLNIFDIVPDFDLNIMESGQDLYDISSKVIMGMRDVINSFRPDIIFVHGDTTSSSMTALASFYQQIPVAHVEAGLRTNDIYSPWPEEINRQITGCIASWHFAPTQTAKQSLLRENVREETIFVTGNTVIDALQMVINTIETNENLRLEIKKTLSQKLNRGFEPEREKYILVTGHRRENFGEGFLNICDALEQIAKMYPDISIIYPVHLNPNVHQTVYSLLSSQKNIYLIDPLEYLPFVYLMSNSYFVLTDSGGIQEEAPGFGKPVLVMRDKTERPEAVEAGTVELVGTDKNLIVSKVKELIENKQKYQHMSHAHNPYGDGNAATKIVKTMESI